MNWAARFQATWARTDRLLALVPVHRLHERPIALRHPFVFYLGHLPAFTWNQLSGALGLGAFDAELDELFERGIDPADEDQAHAQSIAAWPDLERILAYRDGVRRWVLDQGIPRVLAAGDCELTACGRVLHIALEHEAMHHETLLYMLAQDDGLVVPAFTHHGGPGVAAHPVHVPAGPTTLGARWQDQDFGWDNEFEAHRVDVPAFTIDHLPVRNADLLGFVDAGGYADDALWPDPLDRAWRPARPSMWRRVDDAWQVRALFGWVSWEVAQGWPAQVSAAEARAYAQWAGGRLPTEAELQRAATGSPEGPRAYPWGAAAPGPEHGVFDYGCGPDSAPGAIERWGPSPTGSHPAGASAWGVQELVGNGWEWTSTRFGPLPGFRPWAHTYPGYSADFFDDSHVVVFGASWATERCFLRRSFRNWYQGRYPYVFSSFRLVRG